MQPLVATHPPETRLPNAPDYPGLQYPPIFEPGSYSLTEVSNLLRSSRVRSFDNEEADMTMAVTSNSDNPNLMQRLNDNVNNNVSNNGVQDENQCPNGDDDSGFSFTVV